MEQKKPGPGGFFKDIFGYVIITFFSICITIGFYNDGGSTGFLLFTGAASVVGIILIVTTAVKALRREEYVKEEYVPGPWLRDFDRARRSAKTCPNCGAVLGKEEVYCFKCKTVLPEALEKHEEPKAD